MRPLSPTLNLGFVYSRNCLLDRVDKKSDIWTNSGIKSIEQFFLDIRVATKRDNSRICLYPCSSMYRWKTFFTIALYVPQKQPYSQSLWGKLVLLQRCNFLQNLHKSPCLCKLDFHFVWFVLQSQLKFFEQFLWKHLNSIFFHLRCYQTDLDKVPNVSHSCCL